MITHNHHQPNVQQSLDLDRAEAGDGSGVMWCLERSGDLDVNLVVLVAGDVVAEHVNDEVDVVIVVLDGEGSVVVDGTTHSLRRHLLVLIPRGATRAISGGVHEL